LVHFWVVLGDRGEGSFFFFFWWIEFGSAARWYEFLEKLGHACLSDG